MRFSERLIISWLIQILKGLEYVHSHRILHRDLKSSNILITKSGILKLGDFGISKILELTGEKALTTIGTPYYFSPEICLNKPYSFKSDIWSVGCIL